MCLPIRILSNQSFLPIRFFTSSTTHCLMYKTLFSTLFPYSIFMQYLHLYDAKPCFCPHITLSRCNRWSLVGWTASVRVLQNSRFFNAPVAAQDWVGESSRGERSNMGRIRRGRIVCDLYPDVGMNLTAFCSHRLSISPPPCPYFPMPEISWSTRVISYRLPTTITGDLVSSFVFC